ncbi:hypothetical protein ACWENQ_32965 [Nonomuraea sp. NPDC004354]
MADHSHSTLPRARRPVLELSIDLGDHPPLERVTQSMVALNEVWRFALRISQGSPSFPVAWHPEFAAMLAAYRPENYGYIGDEYEIELHELLVRRTILASPWETILTVAANHSGVVMYGGAALITLERILKMLMDWQSHRLALEERRHQLEQESGPTEALEDDDGSSPESAPDVIRAVERFVWKYDRLEAAPMDHVDRVGDYFITLAQGRILRVEVRLEHEDPTVEQ